MFSVAKEVRLNHWKRLPRVRSVIPLVHNGMLPLRHEVHSKVVKLLNRGRSSVKRPSASKYMVSYEWIINHKLRLRGYADVIGLLPASTSMSLNFWRRPLGASPLSCSTATTSFHRYERCCPENGLQVLATLTYLALQHLHQGRICTAHRQELSFPKTALCAARLIKEWNSRKTRKYWTMAVRLSLLKEICVRKVPEKAKLLSLRISGGEEL